MKTIAYFVTAVAFALSSGAYAEPEAQKLTLTELGAVQRGSGNKLTLDKLVVMQVGNGKREMNLEAGNVLLAGTTDSRVELAVQFSGPSNQMATFVGWTECGSSNASERKPIQTQLGCLERRVPSGASDVSR